MKAGLSVLLGVMLLLAGNAQAAKLVSYWSRHANGVYSLVLEMDVRADPTVVRALLTDYGNLPRLNNTILNVDSRRLGGPQDDRVDQLRILSEDCLLFICVQTRQVQNVRRLSNGDLLLVMVPEGSDFAKGESRWRVTPRNNGFARVRFEGDITPRVSTPPFVGTSLVEGLFKKKVYTMINNLEIIANQHVTAASGALQ